jgi:hypothetical protein
METCIVPHTLGFFLGGESFNAFVEVKTFAMAQTDQLPTWLHGAKNNE